MAEHQTVNLDVMGSIPISPSLKGDEMQFLFIGIRIITAIIMGYCFAELFRSNRKFGIMGLAAAIIYVLNDAFQDIFK